jgi:hypothetical protein
MKIISKNGFLLYKQQYAPLEKLSNEMLGQLFRAIFQYQIDGTEIEMSPECSMAFNFLRNQFEMDDEKYQGVVIRNRENGKLGGRPKNNPNNPVGLNKPKKADKDKEIDFKNSQISEGSGEQKLSEEQINDAMNFASSLSNKERW